jgi:hypothetical protein
VPIARLAVAACALLVLAGCGVGHSSEAEQAALTAPAAAPASASPTAAAERSEYPAPGGVRTSIGEGVVLTTSTPKSFTPTDTAYPRVSRAVAIDMDLDNGGTIAFRPSQLGFTALVDGAPAEQVIDSTQGYNGVSGTTDEVAPNQSLRFTVAFAVPEQTCSLQVSVRTDPPGIATVELFDGSV